MTRKRQTVSPWGFEQFYRAFPRRVARGAAERAYARVIADGMATHEELVAGAENYARLRTGEDPRYTCHPATWLNQKRWLDEHETVRAGRQDIEQLVVDALNTEDRSHGTGTTGSAGEGPDGRPVLLPPKGRSDS